MSFARRLTALLLMSAWCFANGHLWVEHPGGEAGHHAAEMVAVEHHHHDGDDHHHHDEDRGEVPTLPEEHHHHELGLATRDAGASMLKAPLVAVLLVAFLLQEAVEAGNSTPPAVTGSPPDERRSGYLLVLQTAHPVRGPSLVG